MCNDICACRQAIKEKEERIKELVSMLNNDMPIQDFNAIKEEIIALINDKE